MASGCVKAFYQVKGDDALWCSASESAISAAVADGVSVVEEDRERGVIAAKSADAAWETIKAFRRIQECYSDPQCVSELESSYRDPIIPLLNYSLSPEEPSRIARLLGAVRRLARKLGLGGAARSESTLAGGFIAGGRGLLITIGDSSVALTRCPRLREEYRGFNELLLMGVSRYSHVLRGLEEGRVKVTRTFKPPPKNWANPDSPLLSGFVTATGVYYVILPPSTVAALASSFDGVVITAWTDGLHLETPLLSLTTGGGGQLSFDTKAFESMVRVLELAGLSGEARSLREYLHTRVFALIRWTALHVITSIACLAAYGTVSRDSLEALLQALVSLDEGPLVEVGDDRSIALAYAGPLSHSTSQESSS